MVVFARGTIFIEAVDTIDCALFTPEHGVSGQSWYLDVQAQGRGDSNYFVSDFKNLKQKIRAFGQRQLDHRLIVPAHPCVRQHGDTWQLGEGWTYTCPAEAVLPLPVPHVDKNSVLVWLQAALQRHVGEELCLKVNLRESTKRTGLCFRYTHGLPGHEGNCQRLLHGHHGRVQVKHNGKHLPRLEHYLAQIIPRRVHFLNSRHVTVQGRKHISLAYEGSQGYFAASLPRHCAIVLPDMESSIEAITHYLAAQLRSNAITVPPAEIVCYEGMDKGASCPL